MAKMNDSDDKDESLWRHRWLKVKKKRPMTMKVDTRDNEGD